jgi:predicted dithiol-disulfide oxidoreductase (DUF899 family)
MDRGRSPDHHYSQTHRRWSAPEQGRRDAMTEHEVVSRKEWQAARQELLKREKEHTRLGDELARQRRELPWVAIQKT